MMIINPFVFSSSAAGHRYWRINIAANNGAGSTEITELEMRETPGGPDATGSGTASDGGSGISGIRTPANAFDNSTATSWNPGGTGNLYLAYDFGAPKQIVEIAITTSSGTTFSAVPKDFTLEYSDDGSTWFDSGNGTMHFYGPLLSATRVFPEAAPAAGYHRFWRIFSEINNGGSSSTALDDVQFRATSGGSDQTATLSGTSGGSTGRAIGSNGGGSDQCWKCFDSNIAGTDPYFMTGTTNTWVGYIFPDPVQVQEVLLQCYTSTTRAPNVVRVEYSDDGTTWTSQKRITGLTWTSNEQKVLAAI